MGLEFLTEKEFIDFFDATIEDLGNNCKLKSTKGFKQHLLDTGRISHESALDILEQHPSLAPQINPEILRVTGYFHDISKAWEKDPFHELDSARYILANGSKLIVRGGTTMEQKDALTAMAMIMPPDFILHEQLGGADFPDESASPHPAHIGQAQADLIYLTRQFASLLKRSVDFQEVVFPYRLDQRISLYADLTNVMGKRLTVEKRVEDIIARWPAEVTPLIKAAKPRLYVAAHSVQELLSEA
jgi:hypothetical protein